MTKQAYVTLVATDSYAAGALVIAHRLRDIGSSKDLVCLVTDNVSDTVIEHLSLLYNVVAVKTLTSCDEENLKLLGRPELDITFTKIHLWNLTDYSKVVFLDADTFPLRNIDDLFDRPHFSAAPDAGWPDCFNSGVFVTQPSEKDYHGLMEMATQHGSFDGGDQGLLNAYFSSWSLSSPAHRLPFTYNTTPTSQYSYAPAHQYYVSNIAICHFIGADKPWKYQRFADGNVFSQGWKGLTDLLQSWWDTWNLHYGQSLPHLLLAKSPADTFAYTNLTAPIKLFSQPIKNAWDTPNIYGDIESYHQHRRIEEMPPLANITISAPSWLSQSAHPALSDTHVIESYFDETSQHSSRMNDGESLDDIPSVSDQHHDDKDNTYQTIDWNPASDSPPDIGISAHIPDLTSFVNAWDQPFESQSVWIAPDPQPIPEMEYDYGFVHQCHPQHNHQEKQQEQRSSSNEYNQHTVFPWDVQQTSEPTRIWLDEHVNAISDGNYGVVDYRQSDISQDNYRQSDDTLQHIQQVDQHYHHHDRQADQSIHTDAPSTGHDDHHSVPDPAKMTAPVEIATYAMDTMAMARPMRSPSSSVYSSTDVQNEDHDWSDRDLIPIQLKSSSKLNIDGLTPTISQSPIGSRRGSVSKSRRSSVSSSRPQSRNITAPTSPALVSNKTTTLSTPGYSGQRISSDFSQYSQQLSSAFTHKSMYYSKQTPYTSAAATPVRERDSFFDNAYGADAYIPFNRNQVQDYANDNGNDEAYDHDDIPDFFLDYSFDESLKLARSKKQQFQQEEEQQVQRSASDYSPAKWDPEAALHQLKHSTESILCSQEYQEAVAKTSPDESVSEDISTDVTTEETWALEQITFPEGSGQGQPINFSTASSPRTPTVRAMSSNLTMEIEAAKEHHRQQQRASLSLLQPQAAVATLLEAELDLSKSKLFNRRTDYNTRVTSNSDDKNRNLGSTIDVANVPTVAPADKMDNDTVSNIGIDNNNTWPIPSPSIIDQVYQQTSRYVEDNQQGTGEEYFTAYFDSEVMEAARRKLNALTHDISVTSMSSTTTVHDERYEDDLDSTSSHREALQDLSRYSFPPVLLDYEDEPETEFMGTYEITVMEVSPSSSSVSMSPSSSSRSVSSFTATTATGAHRTDLVSGQEIEQLDQPSEAVLEVVPSSDTDSFYSNNEQARSSNHEVVSNWLSHTSLESENNQIQTDDTYDTQSIDSDDREVIYISDYGSDDGQSNDEFGDVVIDTVDVLTEGNDEDEYGTLDTSHAGNTYLLQRTGFTGTAGTTDTTNAQSLSSLLPPTSSPLQGAKQRANRSNVLEKETGQQLQGSTLTSFSISALSVPPSSSRTSVLSASDDNDTVFLSAIASTPRTSSVSSSIHSTSDWYSVTASTPPGTDDESHEEHERALSHLEIDNLHHNMIMATTQVASDISPVANDMASMQVAETSSSFSTALSPNDHAVEEQRESSQLQRDSSSSSSSSWLSSFTVPLQPILPFIGSLASDNAQDDTSSAIIVDNDDHSDDLSIQSEHTEVGVR